mgnify:FL=1
MAVAAFVRFTPKPGMADELASRLADALVSVRTEPGNQLAVVLRDPKDPEAVFEFAIYRDWDAVEAHRAAAHSAEKGPWVQETFGAPMQPHYLETADWPDGQKVA